MSDETDDEIALPSGMLGIDMYKHDNETSSVTEVRVIERVGAQYHATWLGEDNRVDGVGTPEGWECIGAAATDWADEFDDHEPAAVQAVYVAPEAKEWTAVDVPFVGRDADTTDD